MLDFFRPVPKRRRVKIKGKNGLIFRNLSKKSRFYFHLINLFFVGALSYFFYLYSPLLKSLFVFYFFAEKNELKHIALILDKDIKTEYTKNILEYEISIPKIMAESKVKTNISPYNIEDYMSILKDNVVAQARGTDIPGGGKGKMSYLFAHSTEANINMVRKNAVFYLLEKLEIGDEIFVNIEENSYRYLVYDSKIIEAKDLQYLKYKEEEEEIIILQTCWPLGTNWKRYLIFAKRG